MISKTAVVLVASVFAAATAHAAEPVPAATTPAFAGPSIAGVCLLGQEAVLANAKVGQAATARLQQLAQAVVAELSPERKALEDEAKALEVQKAKLKPAQFEQKRQALAERVRAHQAKAAQREQQLQATRAKALQTISQQEQPVLAEVYKARGCGVLFARASVLAGGEGMDLTPAVVQALDAKIATIAFELEPPAPSATQPSAH